MTIARDLPKTRPADRFAARSSPVSSSSWASPASAGRSLTSGISAKSSSSAAAGSTSRPMPISSDCASSCPARPAARSDFPSASCGPAIAAGSRHGPASRCLPPSRSSSSPMARVRSAGPTGAGLLHGLKLVAVAIVAQAVWGMARTLCPDRERASIAVVAALIILFSTSSVAQIGAIAAGRHRGVVALPGRAADSDGHMMPCRSRAGRVLWR